MRHGCDLNLQLLDLQSDTLPTVLWCLPYLFFQPLLQQPNTLAPNIFLSSIQTEAQSSSDDMQHFNEEDGL